MVIILNSKKPQESIQTIHLHLVFNCIPFLCAYLHAFLPADPEVSPGEEAGHSMPCQRMDPALLPQLDHNSVYPRKACPSLYPLGQCLLVSVPGDLDTYRVTLHLVKAGVVGCGRVEELSPQQLAIQGKRWGAVLLDLTR